MYPHNPNGDAGVDALPTHERIGTMSWRHPNRLLVGAALVVAIVAALAAIMLVIRPGRDAGVVVPPEVAQRPTTLPIAPTASTTAPTAPPAPTAGPTNVLAPPPTPAATVAPTGAPALVPTVAPSIAPTPPSIAPTAPPAPPPATAPPAPAPAKPTLPTTGQPVPPTASAPAGPAKPTSGPVAKTTPVPAGLTEQTSRVYRGQEYYLYVPKSYDGSTRYRLLVMIHGYGRRVEEYTEEFTEFADRQRYVILSPYFPEDERFQQLGIGEEEETIRFDERTLGLVAEVGGRLNVETERFDLFGFSAGGQFAHRFLYAHPDRLRSVVVAAPGTVTVPTDRYRWPMGLRNLDSLAKVNVDLNRVRQVRVMLIVGQDDKDDENLRETDEANRFGKTRLERARALSKAWDEAKIGHQYVEVKDLDHTLDGRISGRATRFFGES